MSDIKKKRFIAGALCPGCKAQDTVYTFLQNGEQWRACARCDMRESMQSLPETSEAAGIAQELPTRVNQPRLGDAVLPHETPVEAVVLVDIAKPKPKPGSKDVPRNKNKRKPLAPE
ncbi:MAG: YheV family putative metal-binding protein [Pseudomonadales bacterium]|nr:YheV family putative metal-binding protein [Pseudomonadales bacterium]